jgi:hypothetical protein
MGAGSSAWTIRLLQAKARPANQPIKVLLGNFIMCISADCINSYWQGSRSIHFPITTARGHPVGSSYENHGN